ncbi:MAG: phosphate ABC transporter substrate-binding/OmpA family protein [Bacteroidota bacterium]
MISIVHSKQNQQIAHELGLWLEEGSYATGGLSFGEEHQPTIIASLAVSQAAILVISPELNAEAEAFQLHIETIKRLHIPIIPLLLNSSDAEFRLQETPWTFLIGRGSTVEIPKEGLESILSRVLAALKALGVQPNDKPDKDRIRALRQFTGRNSTAGTGVIGKRKKARRRYLFASVIVLLVCAGAYQGIQYYLLKKQQAIPPRIVLRLHGSNTIGASLAPALIERFTSMKGGINYFWLNGANALEKKLVYRLPQDSTRYAVELFTHGSAYAFTDLSDSTADIGMASRSVKPDEEDFLRRVKKGDMGSPECEHIIGLDGIAVIVHPANPIHSLTIEQIAGIFGGKITLWSQVGGESKPILLFAREKSSGTFDTFENLVLKRYGFKDVDTSAKRFEDSNELSKRVSSTEYGIGFIGLPYVNDAKAVAVADGDAPTVYVNALTIAREDYPLARRLFLYIPSNPGSAWTRDFVRFTLSDEGQEIVKRIGFVDVRITTESNVVPPASAPAEYTALTASAKRLSMTFRFKKGSESLDTKALQDIDRIVKYESKNGILQLILIGFTDNEGDKKHLQEISFHHAHVVADEFHARGLNVDEQNIHGFGTALPLTTNTTPEGRQKNRRVEVWMK